MLSSLYLKVSQLTIDFISVLCYNYIVLQIRIKGRFIMTNKNLYLYLTLTFKIWFSKLFTKLESKLESMTETQSIIFIMSLGIMFLIVNASLFFIIMKSFKLITNKMFSI